MKKSTNKLSIDSEASRLANWLLSLKNPSGFLAEYTNLDNNENSGIIMIDDLGDTYPFIAWLGQLEHKPELEGMAIQRARSIVKTFQLENGLFNTAQKGNEPLSLPKWYDADKLSDCLLGLEVMSIFYPSFTQNAKHMITGILSLTNKKGLIYYKTHGTLPIKIPLCSGKFQGLYIEEATLLNQIAAATLWIKPWRHNKFFATFGLFPFLAPHLHHVWVNAGMYKETGFGLNTAMMTKANANMILGLCAYCHKTQDPQVKNMLTMWVNGVRRALTPQGTINNVWSPKGKHNVSYLGADHSVIDALLEIETIVQNSEAKKLAESIAQAWLVQQTPKGLIPEIIVEFDIKKYSKRMRNPAMERKGISRLDSHTDFGVILYRLYQMTANETYKTVADSMLAAVKKYHRYKDGYAEYVDIQSEKPVRVAVETKMQFLLLKLFIAKALVEAGENLYKVEETRRLLRDR